MACDFPFRMPHVTKTQGSFISDHKTIDRRDKGHEPPRKTTIPFHSISQGYLPIA